MKAADGHVYVEVTPDALDIKQCTDFVSDPGAGAISSFIGTTRNTFEGKSVTYLDYEAYVPMAVRKLKELCAEACSRWEVTKVAMVHRTGKVEVEEASVIICVSSPHRKASLEACHWAIDELKASVPIWKKEHFTDGSVWKENTESRRLYMAKQAAA